MPIHKWWYKVDATLRPIKGDIIVSDLEHGVRKTRSGILLPDDIDLKEENIKPRWGKVWKVGPEVTDVRPGQWILIECARWSRGVVVRDGDREILVHKVDPDAILLVSDDCPLDHERLPE